MLAKFLSKAPPRLTGIDIGSYAVKAITLEPDGDNYKLIAISHEQMPATVVAEREVQDIDALAKTLKKIKQTHHSKSAATAISGSTVFSKVIQMDKGLSDIELEQQIEVEADSLIPYPLAEVYIDFEELGDNPANKNKVDVLLSAARRQSINSRSEAINSVGISADIVDIEGYALGRAGQFLLKDKLQDNIICCIDIGVNQTLMAVIKNGDVIFANDQNFGSSHLMQSLAMSLGLEPSQALEKYQNNELPEHFDQQILLPFQMNMVQQVKRIIQMYMTSASHEPISTLLFSGSTLEIPGTEQQIEDGFMEEVIFAQPFANIKIANSVDNTLLSQNERKMMVALGLALRGFSSCHI